MQRDHVFRGEEDGREADDQRQAGHDRVAVAEALGDVAVDEEADDLADVGAVRETGLPACWDLVRSIREFGAVFPVELREAVEVGEQAHVVAFHADARGDQQGPRDCFGVESDALEEGHGVLFVGGDFGVLGHFVHGCRLGEMVFC